MNLTQQLNAILESLRVSLGEIKGAIVASADGLAVAHSMSGGDPQRMAAMVATALGLGKKMVENFGGGSFKETSVAGQDGQVFIFSAGNAVLAVVTKGDANIGLINIECRSAARQISDLV